MQLEIRCRYAAGQTEVHWKEPPGRWTLMHTHSLFVITLECGPETKEHFPLKGNPGVTSPSISGLSPPPTASLNRRLAILSGWLPTGTPLGIIHSFPGSEKPLGLQDSTPFSCLFLRLFYPYHYYRWSLKFEFNKT